MVSADGATAVVGGRSGPNWEFSVLDLSSHAETGSFGSLATPFGTIHGFSDERTTYAAAQGFALTPDGERLIASDRNDGRVFLYDVPSGAVLATLPYPGPGLPENVVVSGDGHLAVFAHDFPSGVAALDLDTLDWSLPYGVSGSTSGSAIALLPDGKTVAIQAGTRGVEFLDLETGARATVDVPFCSDLALTGNGRYVVSTGGSTDVIDVETLEILATLPSVPSLSGPFRTFEPAGAGTDVVYLDPETERVGVVHATGSDAELGPVTDTGEGVERDAPIDIEVLSGGDRVVTLNRSSRSLSVVDLRTRTVLADHAVGAGPVDVAVTPDDGTAVVANEQDQTVSLVDLTGTSSSTTLPVPGRPCKVIVDDSGEVAFVLLDHVTTAAVSIRLFGSSGFVERHFAWNQQFVSRRDMALSRLHGRLILVLDPFVVMYDPGSGALTGFTSVGGGSHAVLNDAGDQLFTYRRFGGQPVYVYDVSGQAPNLVGQISACGNTRSVLLDGTGAHLYVTCGTGTLGFLSAYRTADLGLESSLSLPHGPELLVRSGNSLYSTAFSGAFLMQVSAQGANLQLVTSYPLLGWPSDLAFSPSLRRPITVQAGVVDAIEIGL